VANNKIKIILHNESEVENYLRRVNKFFGNVIVHMNGKRYNGKLKDDISKLMYKEIEIELEQDDLFAQIEFQHLIEKFEVGDTY
jgi:hypothetical protein